MNRRKKEEKAGRITFDQMMEAWRRQPPFDAFHARITERGKLIEQQRALWLWGSPLDEKLQEFKDRMHFEKR